MLRTLITLVVFLTLALSSCTRKNDDGNLLVFHGSLPDEVKSLDPANAYDGVSLTVLPNIYETLYQYSYLSENYQLEPLLAADLPKVSADRLTVTIPLKHGVFFQDDPCFKRTGGKGRELTAHDFVHAFKRLALPSLQSQGWWIFDGKIKGINEFHDKLTKATKGDIPELFSEKIEGLQALDNYTLQLKLTAPYPQLLYVLAMSFTAPVPPEAIELYGDESGNITDHPVGTGPFILKNWERSRQLVLERNSKHHPDFYPTNGAESFRKKGLLADAGKTLPFLDRLTFKITKEQQPRWLNFMRGNEDLITIPKDNFPQAIKNKVNLSPEFATKGLRLSIETGAVFYYISFNMRDKLLGTNKLLRQALSAAIDRDKWIEIFTNSTGMKMTTALPPGIQDRPKSSKLKYDYNLQQAKELLKKAGYPEGKELPSINFDLSGSSSLDRQYGEFFTSQWSAIGVKVNVILNTFPAYLEKSKQGNLQISLGGWNLDYPDAENVYQLLYGPNQAPGPNSSNYNSPEMNKLYLKMASAEPGPARAETIQKMDDLLQEEAPWAFGYYFANYELTQPWLLNYRGNDIIPNKFKYLRVDREAKEHYLSER
jgi:ABC-type transport system substrate-binding protein